MELTQYQIVLVNLNPKIGSEINKTRPCVIISPDEMNQHIRTITLAPMTSQSRDYPSRVKVKHNNISGWVVLDQIRTVDKKRVIKVLDILTNNEISEVKSVIRELFVD